MDKAFLQCPLWHPEMEKFPDIWPRKEPCGLCLKREAFEEVEYGPRLSQIKKR
jgi:hypothetical protein